MTEEVSSQMDSRDMLRVTINRRVLLRRAAALGLAAPAVAAFLAACGSNGGSSTSTTAPTATTGGSGGSGSGTGSASPTTASGGRVTANVQLTGAGSTFDNPLFSKAFSEYSKLYPNIRVNYQSVGSGAGIQQLTQKTVDFGASDAPMTPEQLSAAENDVVHIPVTLGAVAVAYNLPGVNEGLKLTGPVLADIYLGNITKWNDAKIAQLNPGMSLPSTDVAVVHRSDGSGTTDIFTYYLAAVSPDWKQNVGAGLSVNWPVGIGGKGSEGVSGQVKQIQGGIGYFELAYAKQNNLTSAAIQEIGGDTYLLPTVDGATACAAGAASNMPADLRVRIAGCKGSGAYPISGFSWVILRKTQTDANKAQALVDLLWWLVQSGQQYSKDLYYAPLPDQVVKLDEEKLKTIEVNGKPITPNP